MKFFSGFVFKKDSVRFEREHEDRDREREIERERDRERERDAREGRRRAEKRREDIRR